MSLIVIAIVVAIIIKKLLSYENQESQNDIGKMANCVWENPELNPYNT